MAENKPWFMRRDFSYFILPADLFNHPKYKSLSIEAKVLYSLFLNRTSLSYINREKWTDEQQRIFIIFSQTEIAQKLNCGHDKATKVMRELEQVDLVCRGPQKRGQTARIYVLPFEKVRGKTAPDTAEKSQQPLRETSTEHSGKTAANNPEEFPEQNIPYTNEKEVRQQIKANIAYEILKEEIPLAELNMIVSVMTELACLQRPSIRIKDRVREREELKAQILSMDDMTIRYVYDVLENTQVPIRNPRNYIRAILSDATEGFMDCYYTSRVNHDLGVPQGWKKP